MKKIGIISLIVLVALHTACKKRERITENDQLKLKINTISNGTAIVPGLMNKENAAGNMYSIDLLKYYITGIELTDQDGKTHAFNNYDLIDITDESSSWITAPSLPYNRYTKIKLCFGIDRIRNHEGAQDGDLDPIYGMIWTWNTGYIFYKHEGHYRASDSTIKPLTLHLGTDRAYSTIELPINWDVTEASKALYLNFDVNNFYNNPVVDFNTDNNRNSTTAEDIPWIDNMTSNISDAFSVDHTE